MIQTILVWYKFSELTPKLDYRVIIFTPSKDNKDKYRIVDSQFATKCTDATYWAYLPLEGF